MTEISYTPPATVAAFMMDNSLVRALLGPVGSGKTTGMAMECARRMAEQPVDANGVRKSRVACIRNTGQQLRQTVLPEIEKWLMPAFRYKVTDSTLEFRIKLADGSRIESDWMLIPLDTPQDVRRLLSLNLSFAWVSEFREVPLEIIESLEGRVGRFRSVGVKDLGYYGVVMESNMPDEDTAWYRRLELERPSTWKVFHQPGGMSAQAENKENLRPNYYEDLLASNTKDWSDIYIHAQYGRSLSGQAVFRASFRPEFHISKGPITPIPSLPLMIGQDFGRTPASLIAQVDNRSRLTVLRELFTLDSGIEQFATRLLRPMLLNNYTGMSSFMVGDPSGKSKNQVNEESPFDALKRMGFQIYGAPTNDLEPRLRAVEQLFLQQIDGGPMLIIDGAGCPTLVQALRNTYRFKRKQNNELEEKPDKTHPWSDLADCLQYLAMSMNAGYVGKVLSRSQTKKRSITPTVAGWT